MQFPYACESYKNNYSDLIKKCYASATSYMPLEEEREYARSTIRPLNHFQLLTFQRITDHRAQGEAEEVDDR